MALGSIESYPKENGGLCCNSIGLWSWKCSKFKVWLLRIFNLRNFLTDSLIRNAIRFLGYQIKDAETVEDIKNAEVIVFPGQGCFHQAMQVCYCGDE